MSVSVATPAQFVAAVQAAQNIVLTADLDFANFTIPRLQFHGDFDGNGFAIRGLGGRSLLDILTGTMRRFRLENGMLCTTIHGGVVQDAVFDGAQSRYPLCGDVTISGTLPRIIFNRILLGTSLPEVSDYDGLLVGSTSKFYLSSFVVLEDILAFVGVSSGLADGWPTRILGMGDFGGGDAVVDLRRRIFLGMADKPAISSSIVLNQESAAGGVVESLFWDDEEAFRELLGAGDLTYGSAEAGGLRRVAPWLSPGNNAAASFTARLYRNEGAGWSLLDETGSADGNFTFDVIADGETGIAADPLVSAGYSTPPPPNARNLARHPNGFFVCSAGRTFYASVAGAAGSWPAPYTLDFPSEIMGIVEFNNNFFVFTESRIFDVRGEDPSNLSARDLELVFAPRGGAVRVGNAVYYFTDEGIASYSGGTVLETAQIATRRDWGNTNFAPLAVSADGRYYLFFPQGGAFCFSPRDGNVLSKLKISSRDSAPENFLYAPVEEFSAAAAMENGDIVFAAPGADGQTRILEWTPVPQMGGRRENASWKSRRFRFRRPVSFRAAKVRIEKNFDEEEDFLRVVVPGFARDDFLIGAMVSPTAGSFVNSVMGGDGLHYMQPVGGGLQSLSVTGLDGQTILEVYAGGNNVLRKVLSEPHSERFLNFAWDIPGGFKASEWEIRVLSNQVISGAGLARSKKQLNNLEGI